MLKLLLNNNLCNLLIAMHKIRTRWQRSVILHLLPCHIVYLSEHNIVYQVFEHSNLSILLFHG